MPYATEIKKRLFDAIAEVQAVLAEIEEYYPVYFKRESEYQALWDLNEKMYAILTADPEVMKLVHEEAKLALGG